MVLIVVRVMVEVRVVGCSEVEVVVDGVVVVTERMAEVRLVVVLVEVERLVVVTEDVEEIKLVVVLVDVDRLVVVTVDVEEVVDT